MENEDEEDEKYFDATYRRSTRVLLQKKLKSNKIGNIMIMECVSRRE